MLTIHKFPVHQLGHFRIDLPEFAQILTVQMQGGQPMLWVMLQPECLRKPRLIKVFGTGHEIDDVGRYIGTIQLFDGGLVYHFFEGV